jgi:S-phase kinase-associated protein 1
MTDSLDCTETPLNEIIHLISKSGKAHTIKKSALVLSNVIKTMIEYDTKEREIPLSALNDDVLEKIIVFMEYHENVKFTEVEKPIKSTNIRDLVSYWDADFINVDKILLFDLLQYSNYLDIKELLDLCCAKIATMIKGKTKAQLEKNFG